ASPPPREDEPESAAFRSASAALDVVQQLRASGNRQADRLGVDARGGQGRMAAGPFAQTSVETVRRWHSLAERRRRHFVELYRSERWKRYYSEEAFLAQMREAIHSVEAWENILQRSAEPFATPARR